MAMCNGVDLDAFMEKVRRNREARDLRTTTDVCYNQTTNEGDEMPDHPTPPTSDECPSCGTTGYSHHAWCNEHIYEGDEAS